MSIMKASWQGSSRAKTGFANIVGVSSGVIMWKYGISPYHNTDKNWVSVKDTTWRDIVAPTGLAYNMRKTPVANCRPGVPPSFSAPCLAQQRLPSRPAAVLSWIGCVVKKCFFRIQDFLFGGDEMKGLSCTTANSISTKWLSGAGSNPIVLCLGICSQGPFSGARPRHVDDVCRRCHWQGEVLQGCFARCVSFLHHHCAVSGVSSIGEINSAFWFLWAVGPVVVHINGQQ